MLTRLMPEISTVMVLMAKWGWYYVHTLVRLQLPQLFINTIKKTIGQGYQTSPVDLDGTKYETNKNFI
jgi:hypothetical protein